jgi:hypothetical protein
VLVITTLTSVAATSSLFIWVRVSWQVVFSVAWWIGTKDDNPEELRLEMPLDLQQVLFSRPVLMSWA